METGKAVATLRGHAHYVTDVDFLFDGKHVVSTSQDGTKKIWNIDTRDPITVVHFPDGEWYIYHDEGNFECSSGARRQIRFVKELAVYETDQLWSYFFTSDLLAKFTGRQLAPRQKNIDEVVANAPGVPLADVPENETRQASATVEVAAQPGKNGLGADRHGART